MPHAVLVNEKSLDLIATNNGGLQPQIEEGGTYFILPDDPNDHAKLMSAMEFSETYEFVEAESDSHFRRVAVVVCPRCGGDHSWCQNVQPGEFG